MTDRSHRLYAVVLSLVVFFVMWAAVAARPWVAATPDPRLAGLAQREQQLRARAKLVEQIVARRLAVYDAALKRRRTLIAKTTARSQQAATVSVSSPSVRVVTLPPLTMTRTS